jgi:hypothetical protein
VKVVTTNRTAFGTYVQETNLRCRRCDTKQVVTPHLEACNSSYHLKFFECLQCKELNLELLKHGWEYDGKGKATANRYYYEVVVGYPARPRKVNVPKDCPENVRRDFEEAAKLLSISPMASAAFSRRCLQALLRVRGYTQKDLIQQIKALLDEQDPSKVIPYYIARSIDAVRNFGNFSAHEITNKETAAILAVEPEEAKWSLEVVEQLIDYYYVKLADEQHKLADLNEKLVAAGKPPILQPPPLSEEPEAAEGHQD